MRRLEFQKPAGIKIDGEYLTDHNRSSLDLGFERIETNIRTQFGSVRKYYRADKRSVSTSWSMLPGRSDQTVDGYTGAEDLRRIFSDNRYSFTVTLSYDHDRTETFEATIESFSMNLQKRWGGVDYYEVSLSISEI